MIWRHHLQAIVAHIGEENTDDFLLMMDNYFDSGGHMKQLTAISVGDWMKTKDGHEIRRTGTGWEVRDAVS